MSAFLRSEAGLRDTAWSRLVLSVLSTTMRLKFTGILATLSEQEEGLLKNKALRKLFILGLNFNRM